MEKLALLAATSALNKPRHAELFAETRLAANHATMYVAVDLGDGDMCARCSAPCPEQAVPLPVPDTAIEIVVPIESR